MAGVIERTGPFLCFSSFEYIFRSMKYLPMLLLSILVLASYVLAQDDAAKEIRKVMDDQAAAWNRGEGWDINDTNDVVRAINVEHCRHIGSEKARSFPCE